MIRSLAVAAVCLASAAPAWAQINATPPPLPTYDNIVGFGVSYGWQLERDAEFGGWSADYGRRIFSRWILTGALTWDRETERRPDRPDERTDTLNAVGTISYGLTEWMSLTTGAGKGFADTSGGGGMRFKDGDWATGIAAGFSMPGLSIFARDSIGLSVAYEYNLSQREPSVSVDVTYGLSF